jgi:tRNA A-37 threonylcarbamoyl transferase component Bud32
VTESLDRLKAALADRYAIEREIGHGGTAIVYQAEDVKHHRKVVLKMLRSELAAVLGAERFLKEIEVTANLQHPNILPLYDSGESDGLLYYVMPLVEGESLRQKLDREHQLPVEEVVEIARSVATALDYAHRHGVIHRDIKPSNILLNEGQALVADFGIALAMRKAGGESRLTETGLSVGTPHYMSPEQAAGDRELDARSDIYSLGATTYEMLVGEPPHVAKSPQAVVAKILSDTPAPIRSTRELVPMNVEAAVAKALARTPADRFASGAEFAAALTNPLFTLPALAVPLGGDRPSAQATIWARLGPALAAVCVAAVGLALWGWLRPEEPKQVARYALALPPAQQFVDARYPGFDVALRAATIVYTGPAEGAPRLWVKDKGQLEARPVPGTDSASFPSISPDATEVVFNVGFQLRRVRLQGGAPVTIADNARDATWMEDGTLIYYTPQYRLRRMPASGGVFEDLWPEQPEDRLARNPVALPGSKGVLFTLCDRNCLNVMDTWVLDVHSGQARQLITGAAKAWYLEPGYVVFIRPDGAVFALPFDVGTMEPTGTAVPLLEGVKVDGGWFPDMALKPDGTLLMLLGGAGSGVNVEMVWVTREGAVKQVDPGWQFANPTNGEWALSPDGSRLAIGIHTDEGDNIWIKELNDGPLLRLTHDPNEYARPVWTRDGRSVYYTSLQTTELRIQQADGSGNPRPFVVGSRSIWQADMTPDGAWLVGRVGGTSGQIGGRDIVGYRLDQDTAEVPLLVSEYDEVSPQLSPDGRWLAYASQETGEWEIYVRPFPDVSAGKWAVSRGGGYGPRWAHSGRELFYVSPDSVVMVATVEGGDGFQVSDRRALFKLPDGFTTGPLMYPFDVAPDDQRFIMQREVTTSGSAAWLPMVLIENWAEEVKERVRGQRR